MERRVLQKELRFKMSRSSGKGGQHVNKVSTRVSLFFDIPKSACLEATQKELVLSYLSTRISSDGVLQISCQKTRSQFKNKQFLIDRFFYIIEQALRPKKKRKRRSIPKAVLAKRRKQKQHQSEKKNRRRKFAGKHASELSSI